MVVCSKCGIPKPHTSEYFCYQNGKLRKICKVCQYKYSVEYNREKIRHNLKTIEHDSKLLKSWRVNRHLTQLEASKVLNISYTTYANIERHNTKRVNRATWNKIIKTVEKK